MGLFSNLDKAQVTVGGNWLKAGGKYLVCIEAIKLVTSKKTGDKLYTVELGVIESNHPEIKAGAKATWQVNLDKHKLMAPGNIKEFIQAAMACPEEKKADYAKVLNCTVDEVYEKMADRSLESDNPLRNQLAYVEVVNKPTQNKTDFSKHNWAPVEPEKQAKVADYRKAVGLAA